MTDASMHTPLVSVIVPVYNAEPFLRRCLDSVLAQSMDDLELIVVNDGSTDSSLQILHEYAAQDERVTVIDQENAGQGAARNLALGRARGEYVLFVDADDFIERVTLQVTTARAMEDSSDLVHFDWKLYTPNVGRPGDVHYYNVDPFWHNRVLLGAECDELLRVQNFYSVTKLYRRSFLEAHGIRFEEGRIYEDNPFVLQVVNRAQTASLVHSPLYTIDPRPDSSTRSHVGSDKHARDHLHAVRRTFELLDRRSPQVATYLADYHVKKIGPYYEHRIPKPFRRHYMREFVKILHEADLRAPAGTPVKSPMRLALRFRLFERNRASLFRTLIGGKNTVMPHYKRVKRLWKHVKRHIRGIFTKTAFAGTARDEPVLEGTVSFLGLDFKYAGNSRFLFERLLRDQRFAGLDIRFVTTDTRVDPRFRLEPGSPVTNLRLSQTEFLIAESWIPPSLLKNKGSTWIQVWHGTPLKKMLFDSHEPKITGKRRHHKNAKFRDILNWDYFVVDSQTAAQKFETAFLMDPAKMIRSSYPRVDFLVEHSTHPRRRNDIRELLGVEAANDKKILLYAPTWRDSNYGRRSDHLSKGHLLDVTRLSKVIGEEYLIAVHDHDYLPSIELENQTGIVVVPTLDIQELLLAADIVITDYSSVVFDAQAIGVRVLFYASDQPAFEADRGLYEDLWESFSSVTFTTLEALRDALQREAEPASVSDRYLEPLVDQIFALQSSRLSRSDTMV